MRFDESVRRLLSRYESGYYSLVELFPALVEKTPVGSEKELLAIIPPDLAERFREWIRQSPLEGGISICAFLPVRDEKPYAKDEQPFPIAVIRKLKELVAEEKMAGRDGTMGP